MTPLHALNYCILQWFFIRLAKVVDDEGKTLSWTILKAFPLSGYDGRPYRLWGLKP